MVVVSYNIPEELDKRIRERAEEEGRSLSAMATRLLERSLGRTKTKSLARLKATEEDYRLAEWILAGVKRLKSSMREPNLNTWAEDCRKMREIDKRTPRQIAEVFKWANNDPFWQVNILSPAKLRKQFDRLELLARQPQKGPEASCPSKTATKTQSVMDIVNDTDW